MLRINDKTISNYLHIIYISTKYLQTDLQVPPESVLLPISTHLVHFLNKRQPKLQARDAGIWWGTLGKLQLMLRKAAKVKWFTFIQS